MKRFKKITSLVLIFYTILPFPGLSVVMAEDGDTSVPQEVDNQTEPMPEQIIEEIVTPTIPIEITPIPESEPTTNTDQETQTGDALSEVNTNNDVNSSDQQTNVEEANENTETNSQITNNDSGQANTGDNQSENNGGSTTIITGDASAYATLINLINTNLINSNLKIAVVNDFDGNTNNIDLSNVWSEDELIRVTGGLKMLVVSDHALANIDNKVSVLAQSGINEASNPNGEVLIITGDAVAIANVINIINVNLVSANLFIGIANVSGDSLGDVILPNPEDFSNGVAVELNQLQVNGGGVINNNQTSNATSGNNSVITNGENNIFTGNSISIANNLTTVDETSINQNELAIMLNLSGNNTGNVYNWSEPGSVDMLGNLSNIVFYQSTGSNSFNGMYLIYKDSSQAFINNEIQVVAQTGGNTVNGGWERATIITGQAVTINNLINLINTNILGGGKYLSFINIAGDWSGNVIFAYPDLSVKIRGEKDEVLPGETIQYLVEIENIGYKDAGDTKLEISLPNGVNYKSDESHKLIDRNDRKIGWTLGGLKSKEKYQFKVDLSAEVNQIADVDDNNKIVKPVYAADNTNSKQFNITAVVSIPQTESDLKNNQSSTETKVVWNVNDEIKSHVEINAKNNVVNPVNPGDVVTFEVELKNNGEGDLNDGRLVHEVYDADGNLWSINNIDVGSLPQNKEGRVWFGLTMDETKGGKFTSKTRFIGKNRLGHEIESNTSDTNFMVKLINTFNKGVKPVKAAELSETKTNILGTSKENQINLWPYIILFISSGIWLKLKTEDWLKRLK